MTPNIKPGLVSTIIPVFNRPEMIVEAVNSVLAQTYRPIEIIVVDDGSTDDTSAVLQALASEHSEITVLTLGNTGPGVAREAGRGLASGEFIQYLDSDDLLLPNKFSAQVAGLLDDDECAAAYGKTELRFISYTEEEQLMGLTGTRQPAMFPGFLRSRWWSTCTPLFRRSALDQAGPWLALLNEEDWEYDCRVASHGGKLFWVDDFVAVVQRHDDHLSAGGAYQPNKLKDRCEARERIAAHAQRYANTVSSTQNDSSVIGVDDWVFFSKSVFLLARQCAATGLPEHAERMLALSIKVVGGSTMQHKLFKFLVRLFGWTGAAKIVQLLGK